MALSPSELRLVTLARPVCSGAETHTELGTLSVNVISQIQFPHRNLASSPTTSDTYSYSFSQCQSMLVRWKDIPRPQRYWYRASRWGVRATRKKPFSCLSGVFDSIGAPERCLEFIEFVIFGLGVKRAPVCCRKPPRQDRHPHHTMTADVQGQPWSCLIFLKAVHQPLRTLFIREKQLKGYLLCQFSHKSLLGHKKVTRGYSKKNAAISEAGSAFCQIVVVVDTGHPHQC